MTKLPRLGVDITHPSDVGKATKSELETFLTRPPVTCIRCAGTGHQYAENGYFKPCMCRVLAGAPDSVKEYRYIVF